MIKDITLSIALCFLTGCTTTSTIEIIKIVEESEEEIRDHAGEGKKVFITETFVIANPPKNLENLKKFIVNYNKKTIKYPNENKFCIIRSFYKENSSYGRDFKPYYDVTGSKIKLIDVAYNNKILSVHICRDIKQRIQINYNFYENGQYLYKGHKL